MIAAEKLPGCPITGTLEGTILFMIPALNYR